MKRLIASLSFATLLCCSTALAQQPAPPEAPQALEDIAPSPTEDMWFYVQEMRRYDDPQQVIRRREELKAEQRRLRLATQKWFGYSASRPIANITPFMSSYSPMWVSNGRDPFQWVGGGYVTTAVRIDHTVTKK